MIESPEEMSFRQLDQYIQNSKRVPQSHQEWKKYKALKRAIRHGQEEETKRLLAEKVPLDVHVDYSKGYSLVTPLHLAVYRGDLDLIKILLNQGASVNARDAQKETPLMLSVRLQKYSVTDLLLAADSIENLWEHNSGLNHLHIACFRNNVSAVKKLIALGADVNEGIHDTFPRFGSYTALHFAVESRGVEVVKILVDNGADVMEKNAYSMTPLHLAHEVRNEEIIDTLLEAQMFEIGNPADKHGLSHFHIACTRNNVRFVEHFLNQGVNIESEVSQDYIKSCRPLTFAIYYECPDVIEFLLQEGASKCNFDEGEDLYLKLAYETGNEKVVNILSTSKAVKNRAHPQGRFLSKFQSACIKRDLKKVEKLLASRKKKFIAESGSRLWNGVTPLHFLAEYLSQEKIEKFQKLGINFSITDARGLTPLHILSTKSLRRDYIPQNLFDPKMNPSDLHGFSHFHIACTTSNMKLMEKFVQEGINIDDAVSAESLKWSGFTALHFAVVHQNLPAIDFLLKRGAKISLKNGNGLTPFDLAIIYLHEDFSDYDDEKDKFRIIKKFLVEGEKSNSDFDRRGFSLLHVLAITKEDFDDAYFSSCLEKLPEGINQAINFPRSEYHGCTALHFAMRARNYEIGKLLIKQGANIHLKDNRGLSPFQYEIDTGGKYGIIEENPDILCVPGNPFLPCGNSYFHIACLLGNREIMEYYLASGVDVDIRTVTDLDGYCEAKTPLHRVVRSARTNAIETLDYLLDHGANASARDAFLNTPLHHCMDDQMNMRMVESLVAHGAAVNAQNYHGYTPLYLACKNSMLSKIIALLLDHGADINIESVNGENPLSYVYVGSVLMDGEFPGDQNIPVLIKHVKKLLLVGLYVSDINEKMMDGLCERYTFPTFNETKFKDECFKEIRMMREQRINKYTSVYSIISKSSNEMAYLSQNLSLKEIIDSNDFLSNFPNYGYLVRLQYKRGLTRKPLLEKCKLAFNSLVKLSSESVEQILEYLDNMDLENIIKSVKL